jgi:hypothetical protein
MSSDQRHVREIVNRVSARQDLRGACQHRDLGAIIRIFGAHGITLPDAGLTGNRPRTPK